MTDAARIARILEAIRDPADRAWAEMRLAPAWMRRQRRLEARDQAIRDLARFYPTLSSGRAIAEAMRSDLLRVETRGARAYSGDHVAALEMVRALSRAQVPGDRTLREALAGIGQHSPADVAHVTEQTDSRRPDAPPHAPGRRLVVN